MGLIFMEKIQDVKGLGGLQQNRFGWQSCRSPEHKEEQTGSLHKSLPAYDVTA